MKKEKITIAIVMAALLYTAAPVYALQYSITDLGDFGINYAHWGGTPFTSFKINNSGLIVGNNEKGAFIWENGNTTELGNAYIGGLNEKGQIVGGDDEGIFVMKNGEKTQLIRVTDSFYDRLFTYTSDINNNGQIVGMDRLDGGDRNVHAYIWDSSNEESPFQIFTDGKVANMPTAINDKGMVTVQSWSDGLFLWENGVRIELTDFYGAWDINNADQIAGSVKTAEGSYHAALWEDSLITDMGTLDGYTSSTAWAVNELGQAVGSSYNIGGDNDNIYWPSDGNAFYWDSESGMINLNDYISPDSGWDLIWASDINDYGYIVGVGTYNGETRGFLATPTPEPATMILLGTGLIGLAGIRRKTGRHPAVQNI